MEKKAQAYWYFGDIILDKKHRTKRLSQYLSPDQLMERKCTAEMLGSYLLHCVLEAWVQEAKLSPHICICAIGASRTGIKLLKRFSFHEGPKRTPDGLPIYVHENSLQDIRQEIDAIWGPMKYQPTQDP